MREIQNTLLLVGALIVLPAQAANVTNYQFLGACPMSDSRDCMVYFDPSTTRLYEGKLTLILVQDYDRPHSMNSDGSGGQYSSADVYMTFDCAKRLYKKVETIYRSGHLCTGGIVGSLRTDGTRDGAWKPFPTEADGTIAAILRELQGACTAGPARSNSPAIPVGVFSSW